MHKVPFGIVIPLFFQGKKRERNTLKIKDIIAVRYARGKKPKSYFKKGKLGLKIPLFEKKIKGFALKKGKTYTIYVIDKKNNEAIKAIRLK